MESSNRRRFDRIPFQTILEFEGIERFSPDRSLNLSEGGIFVLTRHPLPVRSSIQIHFQIEDLRRWMNLSGSVIWNSGRERSSSKLPQGMAIQFSHNDKNVQTLLFHYISIQKALRSLDTRIGEELPERIRQQLPNPEKPIPLRIEDLKDIPDFES